jgi:hypothetical protein
VTKRLPVVGSTAATTSFCSARIDGPNSHLFIDGNGKVTSANGTLKEPKPNAFSLRAQAVTDARGADPGRTYSADDMDCPGSTPSCRQVCYVGPLEKSQRATYDLYEHNSQEIRRIVADPAANAIWASLMARWITANAAGGFRWHVSGDVWSPEYARWIASVCRESPAVQHWIYTRSFGEEYLRPLVEQSTLCGGNLAVNLSADADNYDEALAASVHAYDWGASDFLRICYLTLDGVVPDGLRSSDVIFPNYDLRPRQFATLAESPWWDTLTSKQKGLVCPVDSFGKSEKARCGPCDRCMT